MSEPSPEQTDPTGPSAVVDDVETFEAPDQWPTADMSDLDLEEDA
ncbi:MAG TPA: hypothetical protein VIQ11_13045 [Mycobacterium sp.]